MKNKNEMIIEEMMKTKELLEKQYIKLECYHMMQEKNHKELVELAEYTKKLHRDLFDLFNELEGV